MALVCFNHKKKPRWCLHLFCYKHWEWGYRRDDDEWTFQNNVGLGPLFFFCTWREKEI